MPGETPKAEALAKWPGAYCRPAEALGIRGYVVYSATGQPIASAGTAKDAWRKAARRDTPLKVLGS